MTFHRCAAGTGKIIGRTREKRQLYLSSLVTDGDWLLLQNSLAVATIILGMSWYSNSNLRVTVYYRTSVCHVSRVLIGFVRAQP